jgi:hypothetical protein
MVPRSPAKGQNVDSRNADEYSRSTRDPSNGVHLPTTRTREPISRGTTDSLQPRRKAGPPPHLLRSGIA